VKFFQEINRGNRVLSLEEESKLLASATPYIQDIVVFALNTGLRIGEILSLTWKSVDLEKNLLTVFAQKTVRHRFGVFWAGLSSICATECATARKLRNGLGRWFSTLG
jgi:integrase